MPNGVPLSQVITLKDIYSRVMARLGPDFDPEGNQKTAMIKEINAQQKIIAKKYRDSDPVVKTLYEQLASFSFTSGECLFTAIEASNPLIVEPLSLQGTPYGVVPFVDEVSFNGLADNQNYDNSILYTISGRRVKLFTGQNFDGTGITYKLKYTREVNTLSADADLMDLPNDKLDELVNSVMNLFTTKAEPVKE